MKLVENCTDSKDLGEFIMFVHDFAKEAARLTILYWLKEANNKTATEINLILSHTLHKIKPATPCVARLYIETLKVLYLHRSDPFVFGHSAPIIVDNLFEDFGTDFKDYFKILQDDVIFLLTFLNDTVSGNAEEFIDNTFWEDVYGFLPIYDMKRDFSHKMGCLSGFIMKIETINTKIRKFYCEFPDSSLYDLPKITSPWYLDFLIKNLRNLIERMNTDCKFVPFIRYKTIIFEQELISLSPLFNYIFGLQNELNDIWLQVVDVVHLTECVINSCISSWFVFDHPIWYYMAYLSYVFDKIKNVKKKIEKVKEKNMHNVCSLPHSDVTGTRLKQEWSSKIDEVVVGFDDMARKLIDDLIGEYKPLDIVSIVGMGGLGKTTLARKVSLSVKDDFDIFAFYTVSQDHNIRMLLLGILNHIMKVDDEISCMDDNDLAHKLWKCLSRQKYLIVLDDIWSTSVWNVVKRSFPDDKIGSRVMFTTRLKDVANECKLKCSPFEMPFISDVESWELLQKKVFQNGISPPHLSNIGRHIAESCKGLPLAIVVIAGVLARKERSEGSWSEIAENLFSFLSDDEGCMKILELSYNHLPEYLKPCILYLGAFPEDKLFRVNQIALLWIAEGFIPEYETKSVEDLAKEYFQDLVDRSLIIVNSRGSDGKIKTCNVHDLIHKLCQSKIQEGNFFNIGRGISASTSMYNCYRISDLAVPLTMSGGSSSLENASTLLLFTDGAHQDHSFFKKLKRVHVFYLEMKWKDFQYYCTNLTFLNSLVNLRHLEYHSNYTNAWLPPSISNLWNIQSLILSGQGVCIYVPETLWKMKSLRHVKVRECRLQFSDEHEHEQLDKVISFSTPRLFSGKEVEQLLQRLPVVRKLGIQLKSPINNDNVDTLDIFRKLESLNIHSVPWIINTYLINFPSTLKKLTLEGLHLPLTRISLIAELKCLRVLKLYRNFFRGETLEMEDVVFSHLVFFDLVDSKLKQWNASTESFPCLEQLLIQCRKLEELPPCFGEVSTLKRISISYPSKGVVASVLEIGKELRDLGNKVEVTINEEKVI